MLKVFRQEHKHGIPNTLSAIKNVIADFVFNFINSFIQEYDQHLASHNVPFTLKIQVPTYTGFFAVDF